MARIKRGHLEAGIYHVTTRSAGPIPMFLDDVDRTYFCSRLAKMIRVHDWTCCAFCLMTTHYHLLLRVPENSLQDGMKVLNWAHARRFNARHDRRGHLMGERYFAARLTSNRHMLRALRYIARNPVRAKLCEKPGDWYWSSYRGCAGYDRGFPFVDPSAHRAFFSTDGRLALERLRAFVEI